MKAIVTGASGTVGTALCSELITQGHEVVRYDREKLGVTDSGAIESFVRETAPDVIFHLATATRPTGLENEGYIVSQVWTETLARVARAAGAVFVFTSSVMVYSEKTNGPYTPDSPANATEGFGPEKIAAEARARDANDETRVARLGWQIGTTPDSNNMIAFLHDRAAGGAIQASRLWMPACSFLEESARALVRVASMPPGTYLVNQNREWNFHQIVQALNKRHGKQWPIEANNDFVYDQRMLDDRTNVPPLEESLPELREFGGE
ncbi:sugar nucleotide-binding protein [bacterium]|nr:sugar nucleotide-binding protein [bacterium]